VRDFNIFGAMKPWKSRTVEEQEKLITGPRSLRVRRWWSELHFKKPMAKKNPKGSRWNCVWAQLSFWFETITFWWRECQGRNGKSATNWVHGFRWFSTTPTR
jgi:hypothetical protein